MAHHRMSSTYHRYTRMLRHEKCSQHHVVAVRTDPQRSFLLYDVRGAGQYELVIPTATYIPSLLLRFRSLAFRMAQNVVDSSNVRSTKYQLEGFAGSPVKTS